MGPQQFTIAGFSLEPKVRPSKQLCAVLDTFLRPNTIHHADTLLLYPGWRRVASCPGTETRCCGGTGSRPKAGCCWVPGAAEVSGEETEARVHRAPLYSTILHHFSLPTPCVAVNNAPNGQSTLKYLVVWMFLWHRRATLTPLQTPRTPKVIKDP